MSLIFGINLSDCVYVASDTRVTHLRESQIVYKDCICKNVPLTNDVIVSAAGSVKFSGYLFDELKSASFINDGIAEIKKGILKWSAHKIDKYLSNNSYASACLIFAGLDRSKKKKINGQKYIDYVSEHQKKRTAQLSMKDAVFKGISAKPFQPNPEPELPVCDSQVFALLTDPRVGLLKIEEAGFGEFLAYGPEGFTIQDVPKTLFGQLEFEKGDVFKDMSMLTAFIKSTAEQKSFGTVGGSVVVNAVTENLGTFLPTGTVNRVNIATGSHEIISKTEIIQGKLYGQTQSGLMVGLVDFNVYKSGSNNYII